MQWEPGILTALNKPLFDIVLLSQLLDLLLHIDILKSKLKLKGIIAIF